MSRFDFRTRSGIISTIIQTNSATSTDIDAEAFFARVTAAGGTLTQTEKDAVNNLVLNLKLNGIWTLMKAIYPMVGASAAGCSQNLKSSSFTGTFSSGWTFIANGVTPNGVSAFMDTTFLPTTNLTSSSGHISIYIRTNVEQSSCDIGSANGTDEILILSRFTGLGFVPVYGSYGGAIANSDSRGLYIANRNSLSITTGFKHNTKVYSAAQTVSALPTLSFTLGCQNATTKTRFSTRQYAFASIGDGLTDTNALDFYNAVQTFQTNLSRQV